MTKYLILIIFLMSSSVSLFGQQNDSIWTKSLRIKQLRNIQDSTFWDIERMHGDNEPNNYGKSGFMTFGAYPAPVYDSLKVNSFRGIGTIGQLYYPIILNGKKIVYSSFFIKDNHFNKSKSKTDKIFFTVLTVTDTIDLEKYKTAKTEIVSRNHPDYVGQGFIKNSINQIDFIAFKTPEGDEFALINMRLFHLKYGNVILIAPHKDGTLRSMQLKEDEISSEKLDKFIRKKLLERENVVRFLTNKNVI